MAFIPGESIPQRWLTDTAFARARSRLAYQCGEALARIHAIDCKDLPSNIGPTTLPRRFEAAQSRLHAFGDISPALQFGLNWLIDHAPDDAPHVLLHGDFRTGNLLINKDGLAGVLDWELTHQGPAAVQVRVTPRSGGLRHERKKTKNRNPSCRASAQLGLTSEKEPPPTVCT